MTNRIYNQLSGQSVDAYIRNAVDALNDEGVQSADDLITALEAYDETQRSSRLLQAVQLVGSVRPIRSQEQIDILNSAVDQLKQAV